MFRRLLAVGYLAAFALSSCALPPPPAPAAAPPPPPASAAAPLAPIAAWDISADGTDFRGHDPTGVILFTRAAPRQRIKDACTALTSRMTPAFTHAPGTRLRVTYWLWKGPYTGADQTCENMVRNYDFDRAQSILQQADAVLGNTPNLPRTPLSNGPGPVFLGFAGGNNTTVFFLDGSNFPTSQLSALVDSWKREILQDPAVLAKAQQASASGSATVNGNNVTTTGGSESHSFWRDLWNTVKPALGQFLVGMVPILIGVIKVALSVA